MTRGLNFLIGWKPWSKKIQRPRRNPKDALEHVQKSTKCNGTSCEATQAKNIDFRLPAGETSMAKEAF